MFKSQIQLSYALFLLTISILIISLTQCCSSQNINKEAKEIVKNNDFSKRTLPHGSAKVSCTILQKIEKDDKIFCVVKIDTVQGYGVGTKPIGIGSTLEIELSEKLVKSEKDQYKINTSHKLILALIPNGINHTNNKFWKIISREN